MGWRKEHNSLLQEYQKGLNVNHIRIIDLAERGRKEASIDLERVQGGLTFMILVEEHDVILDVESHAYESPSRGFPFLARVDRRPCVQEVPIGKEDLTRLAYSAIL